MKFLIGLYLFASTFANAQTQHYVYLFSLDDGQQTPSRNHTWASFVEVSLANGAPSQVSVHIIDWFPKNLVVNALAMGPQRGRNFPAATAFDLAVREHLSLGQWGPYQISDTLYDLAVKQEALLNSGQVWYRVLDTEERIFKKLDPSIVPAPGAVMCVHAISDIVTSVDSRGFLLTGLKSGFAATAEVAWHFAPWYIRQEDNVNALAPVDWAIKTAMDQALGLAAYSLQPQPLQAVTTEYCQTLAECRDQGDRSHPVNRR